MNSRSSIRRGLFIILIFSFSVGLFAQKTGFKESYDTLNIEAQFDFLYNKSNRYEEYKVMNITGYNLLKQNALDSIESYSGEVIKLNRSINELNGIIGANETKIDSLSTALNETKRLQDSMNFMGTHVSKDVYNSIMWFVIFCLLILAGVSFVLFKRGHKVVKSTKKRLEEVQLEFEQHRKNSLKSEQKISFELMRYKRKYGSIPPIGEV